jgi:hypothetical protein
MARLTVEGAAGEPLEKRPLVARSAIAGDLLTALRIPLRQGRSISSVEMTDAVPVVMINEEAARRFWPGRDPVGSRLADAVNGRETWLSGRRRRQSRNSMPIRVGARSSSCLPAEKH